MVEIADIDDRESLKAWLNDQPREVSVWIASRAAARVLPAWWEWTLVSDRARKRDLTALPILRSLLISSVAAKMPTEDMKRAASAASAADSAADSAAAYAAYAYAASAYASAADSASASAAASAASAASASAYASAAAASAASAYASAAAASASASAASAWRAIRTDAEQVQGGQFPDAMPLWPKGQGPLSDLWQRVTDHPDSTDWPFWLAWYDALLAGRPLLGDADRTWQMLEKIALIAPEVWDQGPNVVNPIIAGIWQSYASDSNADIDAELSMQSPATRSRVQQVMIAMDRHKRDLPPTFDGICGLILLEIERLQGKNYETEREQIEGKRLIGVFLTLYEAIERMRGLVPQEKAATTKDAKEMEGLLRLYFNRFRGLCREKQDDVAEGMWSTGAGIVKGGLILGSAGLASYFSLPVFAGLATGALVFAPDRAGDIVKAAKESVSKTSG